MVPNKKLLTCSMVPLTKLFCTVLLLASFVDLMKAASADDQCLSVVKQNAKGATFSCGYSTNWVGEVFTGLEAQFSEFRNFFISLPAAVSASDTDLYVYVDATGDKLLPLFEANAGASGDQRMIYRFKHTGMMDHVWLLERLPNVGGLRVYQSYVKIYDEAEMVSNFKKSWDLYGKGITIPSADYKTGNLADLEELSAFIKTASADPSMVWTNEMHELWIELFASPSPMNWPNISFGALPSISGLEGYQLEVSIVQVENGTDAEETCCRNGQILANAIPNEDVTIECDAVLLSPSPTHSGVGRVQHNGWLYYAMIMMSLISITAFST